MIKVTLEMWPQGDASRKYPLGSIDIINDGTGSANYANYDGRIFAKDGRRINREARVKDWLRTRWSVFSLLKRMLHEAGY